MIDFCLSDFPKIIRDYFIERRLFFGDLFFVFLGLGGIGSTFRAKLFYFCTSFSFCLCNRSFIGADSRADSRSLKIDISGSNIIKPDNRTSRRSFSAAGFSHEAEHFPFFNVEADVVHRFQLFFAHFEVLTEMFNFE